MPGELKKKEGEEEEGWLETEEMYFHDFYECCAVLFNGYAESRGPAYLSELLINVEHY